jgi:hypothetical protein
MTHSTHLEQDFWGQLSFAEAQHEFAREALHEMVCEHNGECYAFGDSWAGAQDDITRAQRAESGTCAEYNFYASQIEG